MRDKKLTEFFEILSDIVEGHVRISPQAFQKGLFDTERVDAGHDVSLSAKLDLIERVLEAFRIEKRQLNNNLAFSEFIQGDLEIKDNQLRFTPPQKLKARDFGTRPVYLQPKLLIYLLFRHGKPADPIYDIIDNFVRVIWNDLDILDFERTKTGVFRCFTNTRFAANTLRDYGLLKFTKNEAFKTWVLSFTGVMVASKFVRDGAWDKPLFVNKYSSDLHPAIKESFRELSVMAEFVNTLTFITKSNLNFKESFTDSVKMTLPLLSQHHAILKDDDLSRQEKKKKCKEILKKIENDAAVMKLFENLILHLKTGELLNIN